MTLEMTLTSIESLKWFSAWVLGVQKLLAYSVADIMRLRGLKTSMVVDPKGGGGKGVKPPPKYPSPDSKCIAGVCLSCWYDRLPAP